MDIVDSSKPTNMSAFPFTEPSLFKALEDWNLERMLSFDKEDLTNYFPPCAEEIEVATISRIQGFKEKALCTFSGKKIYVKGFSAQAQEIRDRGMLGFHVMHPALDRSTSKDRVFMSIPWHFYEQAKANQKQAPMKWMSSGFSELVWTKMASAGPGETDPRKVWRISDYRVILLANSPDNCAGGLDYDN